MAQADVDNQTIFDPSIQTEDIAYRPSELISCERCDRRNPPARTSCLYCGNALAVPVGAEHLKTQFRSLEVWERGWNVIALNLAQCDRVRVAELCHLNESEVQAIADATGPLPLARLENEDVARFLGEQLSGEGARIRVVSDDELRPEIAPVRLRGAVLGHHSLSVTHFNQAVTTEIPWDDLAVIVSGRLMSNRTDALEKRRRRNTEVKTIESIESSRDEPVIDLYTRSDAVGYRIQGAGFDFSVLGAGRTMLAAENMKLLIAELDARASGVRCVLDYVKVRNLLDPIWSPVSSSDSKGLVSVGFGKREFARSSTTNNVLQFLKYSRLQWHLL